MAPTMLVLSAVSRSLALQSPASWDVARDRGMELTFAAAEDAWTPELARWGAFLPLRGTRSVRPAGLARMAADLRRLAERDWDLVQVQTPIVAALWRLLAPAHLRDRTVYVVHGLHAQRDDRGVGPAAVRALEALLAPRAAAVATVSVEDAAWFRALPGLLHPRTIRSLPGAGVDVSRFRDAEPLASAPRPFALFCGDLNANKDPLLAVAAVERCRAAHPDLGLVVVGEGPLAPVLAELAEDRPWLTLVPRTLDVGAWLAAAAVLLSPSRREGVPRVVIEALAVGTPVVARENRGSRELLVGGAGTILPAGATAEEWARTVAGVLDGSVPHRPTIGRAWAYDVSAFRPAYARLLDAVRATAGARPPTATDV
ncbi:glycosyltransferase [Georgenia faecalis]|uniref:glycosyltransferase n=1 Tax=Georgenia faecalis TaxID=2483799 RepID=UPI000FD815BD|nr:glycosyltransferase [Georgenia faecalis]